MPNVSESKKAYIIYNNSRKLIKKYEKNGGMLVSDYAKIDLKFMNLAAFS